MSPKRKPKLRPKIKIKAPPAPAWERVKTLSDLENHWKYKVYPHGSILIGYHRDHEGTMIWTDGSKFFYGYGERGHVTVQQTFDSEQDVVRYALKRHSKNE